MKSKLYKLISILTVSVILLILFLPLMPIIASDTLFENYNTGDDDQDIVSGVNYWGQTFTPSTAHSITSVKILAKKATAGSIVVSIYNTTASVPSGSSLCSTTLDMTGWSTDAEWHEIVFASPADLIATTKYAITISASSGSIWLREDYSVSSYAGGTAVKSVDSGVNWTDLAYDFMFEEYGIEIIPPAMVPGTYIIPTTNTIILDNSAIDAAYLSDDIVLRMCKREYQSKRVVFQSADAINDLIITASNLTNGSSTISNSNIDIKHIQTWYQFADKYDPVGDATLTPELLLNNKSLIRVNAGANEAWITDSYVNISNETLYDFPDQFKAVAAFPIQDSATLQPVDIEANNGTQFLVTFYIPNTAIAGEYTGTISLNEGEVNKEIINVSITVLPFTLSALPIISSIYTDSRTNSTVPDGEISRRYKSTTQLTAEYQDMYKHGVNYPMVAQEWTYPDDGNARFKATLDIVVATGFALDKIFLTGKEDNLGYDSDATAEELLAITAEVQAIVSICQTKGFGEVYFYGIDEANAVTMAAEIQEWNAIHSGGGKVFVAGRYENAITAGVDGVLDLLNDATETGWTAIATDWHTSGSKINQYSNPQGGYELPLTYRLYAGLQLWQAGLDGIQDWAYQGHYGAIWEEYSGGFGSTLYKPNVMAYPTANGVIDTLEWEGWREGVNDLRYMETLESLILTTTKDTTAAEAFIADLQSSDLTTEDMDEVRDTMIDYILTLRSEEASSSNGQTASYFLMNTVLPIAIAACLLIVVLMLTGNPLAALIGAIIGLVAFYMILAMVQLF